MSRHTHVQETGGILSDRSGDTSRVKPRNKPLGAWRDIHPVVQLFLKSKPRLLLLGAALAVLTVLMGMGLLGLSGWFITSTALAGLHVATAVVLALLMTASALAVLSGGDGNGGRLSRANPTTTRTPSISETRAPVL